MNGRKTTDDVQSTKDRPKERTKKARLIPFTVDVQKKINRNVDRAPIPSCQ